LCAELRRDGAIGVVDVTLNHAGSNPRAVLQMQRRKPLLEGSRMRLVSDEKKAI
jgi:hypothetical protein